MTVSRLILVSAALVTVAAPALAAKATLHASLNGRNEVPGPGKNDARGWATVRVNGARVCYTISVRNLPRPMMAHIHRGRAGTSGPPVATLANPAGGTSHGCTGVGRALARDLIRSPQRFYVNVHSRAFPDGAVRGQLTR